MPIEKRASTPAARAGTRTCGRPVDEEPPPGRCGIVLRGRPRRRPDPLGTSPATRGPVEGLLGAYRWADFSRFPPICRTSSGDFTPDRLDSRSLETLWEWKNRVLLEEYYIFNVVIPLEVEREQSYELAFKRPSIG